MEGKAYKAKLAMLGEVLATSGSTSGAELTSTDFGAVAIRSSGRGRQSRQCRAPGQPLALRYNTGCRLQTYNQV